MERNVYLSNIPVDWKKTKLSDIGLFSKGKGISKNELVSCGCNAIRYGEIYSHFDFQIKNIYSFIPKESIETLKRIKYGDILFAGSGETIDEIGKSVVYLLREDAYASGDTIIFTPVKANSKYLSYFLNVGIARKVLRMMGQGQSVVHIYKKDIENLSFQLPFLPEQKRIVSVIETWDKAIELLTKIIENKKKIKKSMIQKLLGGRKRLKKYRKKWNIFYLSKFLVNTSQRNSNLLHTRVLSVTNKQGIISAEEHFSKVVASKDLSKYKIIFNGEFAYNPSRINVGSIAQLKKYKDGILSPMYVVFKINNINDKFFSNWLDTTETKSRIRDCASGSVRKSVDFKGFCSIRIKLPDMSEQKAIAKVLTAADDEIEILEKKLSLLMQQKKYLLNNLVSGSIRTPADLLSRIKE